MPIERANLLTKESDNMVDTVSGGGHMGSSTIQSGVKNSIFPDISTSDRNTGAVKLRKLYHHLSTQSREVLLGARSFISATPAEPLVDVTIVRTSESNDRRVDAVKEIEAYRNKGALFSGYLFGTQYQGSVVVQIIQEPNDQPPGVGDVLLIDQADTAKFQFIAVRKVETEVKDFTIVSVNGGTTIVRKKVVTLRISQRLSNSFDGLTVSELTSPTPRAKVFNTVVSNGVRYYSARKLENAVSSGVSDVKLDSVFSQLLPASTSETSQPNINPSVRRPTVLASSMTQTIALKPTSITTGVQYSLPSPFTTATISGGGVTITLSQSGEVTYNGDVVGACSTIDGTFTLTTNVSLPSTGLTLTYTPAVESTGSVETAMINITAATQGTTYTHTLTPAPVTGSIRVHFRSFGQWYTLIDDAKGELLGGEGIGGGTILNSSSGSTLSLVLEALPEVGSAILIEWMAASKVNEITPPATKLTAELKMPEGTVIGIKATDALTVTWDDGGTTKTATKGNDNTLSGDATGVVKSDRVSISPVNVPAMGTEFTITAKTSVGFAGDLNAGSTVSTINGEETLQTTIGNVSATTPLIPHSLGIDMLFQVKREGSAAYPLGFTYSSEWFDTNIISVRVIDSGIVIGGASNIGILKANSVTVGTIDYNTGVVTIGEITANTASIETITSTRNVGGGIPTIIVPSGITLGPSPHIPLSARLRAVWSTASSESTTTTAITPEHLQFELKGLPTATKPSTSFTFNALGRNYVVHEGKVTLGYSISVGNVYVGVYDSSSTIATLSNWTTGTSDCTISPLTLASANTTVTQGAYRVAEAPIKVGSFTVRVETSDGILTGTADALGSISGTNIHGNVDVSSGVFNIICGSYVVAADNTDKWYYDATLVESDGTIFAPIPFTNVTYDAVTLVTLPLDASVIGVDSVRLPSDGKVVVFTPGDSVILKSDSMVSDTYTNNSTTDLGVTNLSSIYITDKDNVPLDGSLFTADIAAGTIAWKDLAAVTQPIHIAYSIEDENIVKRVSIDGTVTLRDQLTRDFPANSILSSALLHGDMVSSVGTMFTQGAWTGTWSDVPDASASEILAKYNESTYPVLIDNLSCITDDWLIKFKTSTAVDVISKSMGVLLSSAPISSPISPINPKTGSPYFTLQPNGWGLGWSAGNVLRFPTKAAYAGMWLVEAISPGEHTVTNEDALRLCLEFRGDENT